MVMHEEDSMENYDESKAQSKILEIRKKAKNA